MSSSGEWQCVRRGKAAARRGKAARSEKPTTSEPAEPPEPPDRQRDTRRITEAVNDLRDEDFWLEWRDVLCGRLAESAGHSCTDKTVREDEYLLDCVCYGLGNFSSCVSARYQLAMLLLLFDALQVNSSTLVQRGFAMYLSISANDFTAHFLNLFQIPVGQCSMYDPVFTVSEREILRELGFTVLTENEEGKRAVCRPTLFYLMHCGKALYNNLLWRNWSPHILPKVIVIGNSFLGIQERMLQRELERDYSFLSDVSFRYLCLCCYLSKTSNQMILNCCCCILHFTIWQLTIIMSLLTTRLNKNPVVKEV
uniref:SRR1-like domain-containing protein n=1 Tax=Pygocentrus nattereri TaxID=42514 RepID=A0AAR2JEM2_PYGNA